MRSISNAQHLAGSTALQRLTTSLIGQILAAGLVVLMAADPIRLAAQSTSSVTINVQPVTVSVPATTETFTTTVVNTSNPVTIPQFPPPTIVDTTKPVVTNVPVDISSYNNLCPPSTTTIIQDCSLRNSSFEQNIVNAWLGYHGLPLTDAPLIYQYGTADLRSQIRAFMFTAIENIIAEPTPRSASDQAVYNWISAAVEKNEIAYYSAFTAEYDRWLASPCTFTLNPIVATAFGLKYNQAAFCGLGGLYQSPAPPDISYFKEVAQVNSYDTTISSKDTKAALAILQTEQNMAKTAQLISLGPTLAISGATAAVVAGNIATIAPYLLRVPVTFVGDAAADYATSALVAGISDVLGPAGIVLIFIQIGVTAAVNLQQTDANQAAINAVLAYNANQPPPLASMILDNAGYQKIYETFMAAALPDEGPTQAPPTPNNPTNFYSIYENELGNSGAPPAIGPSFTYTSWDPIYPLYPASNGGTFQVNTYGNGWLVQANNLGYGPDITLFNMTVEYTDFTNGVNYSAEKIDKGRFLVTKQTPQPGDSPCPADYTTGLTPGLENPIVTTPPIYCQSFVTNNLNVELFGNQGLFYNVSIPQAPVFVSPSGAQFEVGQSRIFVPELDSTSVGLPLGVTPPEIEPNGNVGESIISRCSLTSTGTLPIGVDFGTFGSNHPYFTGVPAEGSEGNYPITLTASCGGPSTIQQITFAVGPGATSPAVTSMALIATPKAAAARNVSLVKTETASTGTASPQFTFPISSSPIALTQGRSTQIQVNTVGGVTTITAGANALPTGMTLTDNGDGTALISGIPTGRAPACTATCNSLITATRSSDNASATLALNYTINPPALPAVQSQTFTWNAGDTNTAVIDGSMASTSVPTGTQLSWSVTSGLPSWATFTDQGNNMAKISGVPPVSTSGQSFPVQFTYSYGNGAFTSKPLIATITVAPPEPVLAVNPALLFEVGVAGSGVVNSSTLTGLTGLPGAWKVLGTLPSGLAASAGGTSLTISGTPVSPGSYEVPIQFTPTSGQATSRNVAMLITQPASLANFPTQITLYEGLPANLILPVTAGFPLNPSGGAGDGLPSTTGTNLTLTSGTPNIPGLTFASTGGSLNITGTPTTPTPSTPLSVSAQTTLSTGPVGALATQNFSISVLAPAVLTSGKSCNGTFSGNFAGSITVQKGQSCVLVGGTVGGTIEVVGGNVTTSNVTINSNLMVQWGGSFSVGPGTVINGNLQVLDSINALVPDQICGATVKGNLQVQADIVGAQIGSSYSTCPGNNIDGNLTLQLLAGSVSAVGNTVGGSVTVRDNLASTTIQSNTVTGNLEDLQNLGATQVVNNTVGATLGCQQDAKISGSGNTARSKQGQCSTF